MAGWAVVKAWVGTWDDGDLVDERQAAVSVLDHGFTVADGVFETLRVTDAGVFALTRHLDRLVASARALGLRDLDPEVVRIAVDDVVAANRTELGSLGRLRITYTSGPGPLGSGRGAGAPTLVVMGGPAQPWPPTTTIATVPWVRNERSATAGLKTTSYAENVIALAAAQASGASEAILGNTRGELCEGTGSNVFVIVDGEVVTPPLSSGCLPGVTRQLVIDWFGAAETPLPLEVLMTADEVFLTSATRHVHPVVRADERHWSIAGPISRDLQASFDHEAAKNIDP